MICKEKEQKMADREERKRKKELIILCMRWKAGKMEERKKKVVD